MHVLLLKLNIGCERLYRCRLLTIDGFKPEIAHRALAHAREFSNVAFPGGRGR